MIVERGTSVTLDLLTESIGGDAEDATSVSISILNANGATVVNLDLPVRVGFGHYQYVYLVPVGAELGTWTARWFALIDSAPVSTDDPFTVTSAAALGASPSPGQTCTPWATHDDAIGACAEYGVDPDEVDLGMQIASDILWNLTGRRWSGICVDSIRPQAQWKKWDGPPMWWPSTLVTGASAPFGFCSCNRGRETGCARVPEIRLPSSPVVADSITVLIDGEQFTDFRLDDNRWLVRTDGDQWPCCQNLTLDDDQPNTFSITWNYGRMPPAAGARMAAIYGCQIALSMNPDTANKCQLPARVTRITRQGTSVSAVDPETLIEKGQTGLVVVDQWVASIIAGNARRRATAMVPGHWRGSRRVNR